MTGKSRVASEEAWNNALHHVWALSDPAYTTMEGTTSEKEVVVEADIKQALEENPYTATHQQTHDVLVAIKAIEDIVRMIDKSPAVTWVGAGGAKELIRRRITELQNQLQTKEKD